MKPKSMYLMLLLMIMGVVGVKAEQLELTVANGSYATGGNYINSWTSNTSPTITITASANNMDKRLTSDYFLWHSGSYQPGTYTIAISDTYLITGYTITAQANTSDQTVTAGSTSTTFTSSGETTMSVTGLNGSSTTFTLSGANTGLKISKIVLTFEENNTNEALSSYVCTINNTNSNRGALMYAPTKSVKWIWSSGKDNQTFDATDANCQWVFVETGVEEEYYLYNLGIGKFAIPIKGGTYNGYAWAFSNDAVALKLLPQDNGTYKIKTVNSNAYISVSNSYTGPIINYDDIGSIFTITKVANLTSNITQQTTAAVNKLIHNTTKLSSAPTSEGWYAIRIKSHVSYADQFVFTAKDEITYKSTKYPLDFFNDFKLRPAIDNSIYYAKLTPTYYGHYWQMTNGRFIQNGKPISGPGESSVTGISYDATNGFTIKSTSYYFVPYFSDEVYFIGETSNFYGDNLTYYDIYPIDLTAVGMTAWQMICDNAPETQKITCTRNDVSGLTSVYKNGYFFLPSSVTPAASEFNLDGATNIEVNANNHTVTFTYNPDLAIVENRVIVEQGWQTAGRGSEVMLLRVTAKPFKDATNTTMTVSLKDGSEANISTLKLYEANSSSPEIYSTGSDAPTKTEVATATISGATATFTIGNLSAGTHYFWIGATVSSTATLGAVLDAAVTSISYQVAGQTAQNLDLTSVGDPADRGAMVFNVHSYPFLPYDNGSHIYRIPAMIVADDGSIVVAADKRYGRSDDIGRDHVIDIVVRRSSDGGKTWSAPVTIAQGVGNTDNNRCGYGDPSLVKGKDGKLYCLFAAGNLGYFYGQKHICMSTSTDNGETWSSNESNPPVDLFSTGAIQNATGVGAAGGYGLYDYFVTSGRGLYTSDGILMYLIPAQTLTASNYTMADGTYWDASSDDYLFYSTDDGATWYFSETPMILGGDEAKVIEMNDGSLFGSIRKRYARRFNTATYTKNDDGKTLSFNFGTQRDNSQLSQASQNNQDIFYYQRETETGKTDVIIHSITTGNHANFKLFYSTDQGVNWTEFLNVQTKGTRYVTMDKNPTNGSLYLFFEDQSLNSEGSYTDYNHYPLNFIEITRDHLKKYITNLDDQATYNFDANFDKTFIIKNYSTSAGLEYILSPKYNNAGDVKVYRTADINESAEMVILKDNQNEGFYYVYDVKSNYYLKGSANTNAGTEWTFSTTPVTVKLNDNTGNHSDWTRTDGHIFLIQNSQNSMANAYGGANGNQVKNYTVESDPGSNWYIYATENSSTSPVYVDPTALYYIKNANNGNYITSGSDGSNLGYGEIASAGTYALIPVSGNNGKFYIYDTKNKNFITPEETTSNGGQWTISAPTPSMITIVNQLQRSKNSSWNPNGIMYSLGTYYANAYGGSGLVKNYFYIDKGSNWYLERVDNSTPAIVEINGITDNVGSLVESGVTDGTKLQYTAKLNTVGETSWATQYLPFDLTLPENTSAYYVPEITNNTANLVELQSGIPALTPVVIKSNGATSVSFPITMGLSRFEETNLLKGTLVPMSLDLSNQTTNYSLGVVSGNVGFYKYKSPNGSTTITLGANKAYLEIPVPSSNSVRGFKFAFAGDESFVSEDGGFVDGINEIQAIEDNVIYDLNGLRVNTLRKGIYVVNGKKVVVK